MGLDDLFENHDKHRSSQNYREHGHNDGYNYAGRHAEYKHQQQQYLSFFLSKVWGNRQLRLLSIVIVFLVVVIVVVLIVALISLLHKFVDFF